MFCTKCGAEIPDSAQFCPHCGFKIINLDNIKKEISDQSNITQTSGSGITDNEVSLDELKPVIGKNIDYYIEQFDRIQKSGKAGFNFSAFQYSIFLFPYRKCYKLFVFSVLSLMPFICGCILIILGPFYELEYFSIIGVILFLLGLLWWAIASIWFGIVFNKKYYQHCIKVLSLGDTKNYGTSITNTSYSFVLLFLIICICNFFRNDPNVFGYYQKSNTTTKSKNETSVAQPTSTESISSTDESPDNLKSDWLSSFDDRIDLVRNGSPIWLRDITYDEAYGHFYSNPRWRAFDSTEGKSIVEFSGDCAYNDEPAEVYIQFELFDDDTFSFSYCSLAQNDKEVNCDSSIIVQLMYNPFESYSNDVLGKEIDESTQEMIVSTYYELLAQETYNEDSSSTNDLNASEMNDPVGIYVGDDGVMMIYDEDGPLVGYVEISENYYGTYDVSVVDSYKGAPFGNVDSIYANTPFYITDYYKGHADTRTLIFDGYDTLYVTDEHQDTVVYHRITDDIKNHINYNY
ncbi:zinc-ribbon domain-containing protein [Oribacterium sp. KHPX15]|uniref:zinc ribbon domain-containing protein n=1 Tax=Oribacterium sp. KHPX15 TaxID=1855342 RepID=UPI00089B4AED|nr:zinc ribbon domain-containing protein [Oribacterium sp. KHPX15]SEA07981.1 zinc-ribbon domain-containing protein [Oribacterium sp. KHPX15]